MPSGGNSRGETGRAERKKFTPGSEVVRVVSTLERKRFGQKGMHNLDEGQ